MIGKMLNLPFKVLGSVARAVQNHEAKQWKDLAQEDAAAESGSAIDLAVPEHFDPGEIHIEAAAALAAKNAAAVDVRSAAEFAAGHAPGALHIPLSSIGIRLSEIPPSTTIILFAETDARGDQAVRFLRHRGLDDTWTLAGGLKTWSAAGGTTEKG